MARVTAVRGERDGDSTFFGDAHQHGGDDGHLPASKSNVKLAGSLEPSSVFVPFAERQIADLSVYENFALNSWSEETYSKGGVSVVDITNRRRPVDTGVFLPALPKKYHGEGAHLISVSTPHFSGGLLAENNETCASTDVGGGFELNDVSDPRHPQVLVQAPATSAARAR